MTGDSLKSVNRTFTYCVLIFRRRFSGSQCLSAYGSDAVTPRPTRPFNAGPSRMRKNSLPFGRSVRFPQDHRSVRKPLRRIRTMSLRSDFHGYVSGFQDNKNAAIERTRLCASEPGATAATVIERFV